MTSFWVHWDKPDGRISIHRADCRWCNDGKGMHQKTAIRRGETHDWVSANSYAEAWTVAKALDLAAKVQIKDCGHCHPQ
jgi:hypothetical protein